jgi:Fe-S cluster assembly ATPase SufC
MGFGGHKRIESIHIAGVATYGSTPEILSGLSKFNFLYGPNGVGKTAISKVIANTEHFPSCKLIWKGGTKLQAMVYNRDLRHQVRILSGLSMLQITDYDG